MANEEQHESISKLLTDTVTLLCRNSLPHMRDLKVQGLLAITTDDTDVFIVQINERFAKKTGARFTAVNNDFTEQQQAPPMAQQSAGRVMSGMRGMGMSRGGKMASRRGAIMRKTPQSAPNRIQLNMPPDSPASLAARVKARQQLNFQSPQKRICLQGAGYSPGVKQEAGRGGGAPAAMRATPPRNVGPEAANRMKSPRGGMSGQRTPSRAMQPKSEPMDIPAQDNSMALCVRPVKKEVPVKKEGKGDVICVLSDDEGEHRPTSRHTNQTEDSKAAALEAIMQQALNEVRTTSSNIGSSSGFDGNAAGNAGSYSTDQTHGGFDDVKPFVSSSTWGNSKMMGMAWDGGQQQQRPKIPTQMPTTPVQMKVEGHSFSVASMSSGSDWAQMSAIYSSPAQQHNNPGMGFDQGFNQGGGGDMSQMVDLWSGQIQKFVCPECSSEFQNRRTLRQHQKMVHGPSPEEEVSQSIQFEGSIAEPSTSFDNPDLQ